MPTPFPPSGCELPYQRTRTLGSDSEAREPEGLPFTALHNDGRESLFAVQAEVNGERKILLSSYRSLGARLFNRAIEETGLTPIEMRAALRDRLLRPTLTAPTLRAWRRGNKPTPLAAFLAACHIADMRPADLIDLYKKEAGAVLDLSPEERALLNEL